MTGEHWQCPDCASTELLVTECRIAGRPGRIREEVHENTCPRLRRIT